MNTLDDCVNKREFYINTPVGKLHVYAKHEKDNPKDFPGVFVDIVRDCEEDCLLSCVEYDSINSCILGTIYGELSDDSPTDIRHIFVG